MKRVVRHIIPALMPLLLFGCARESVPVSGPESHTVAFSASHSSASRTSIVEGESSASYLWSADDASRFHLFEDGVAASQVTVSYSTDMRSANISAEFPGAQKPDPSTYTGFVNAATGDLPVVPASQTIGLESYDPSSDIIIAKPLTAARPSDGLLPLQFHRVTAVSKMTLRGLVASERVLSVKLISDKPISGTYNLETESFEPFINVSQRDTLTLAAGRSGYETASSAGELTLWFMTAPVSDASLSIRVETTANVYVKTFRRTISFPENMVTRFTVDLTGCIDPSTQYEINSIAKLKQRLTTSTASFTVWLTDAVVTGKSGKLGYIEDATAGIYLYNCASSLNVGDSYTGVVTVSAQIYSNSKQPEITAIDVSQATRSHVSEVPCAELTIAEVLNNLDALDGRRVLVRGVTNASALSGKAGVVITQNGNSITLYSQNSNVTISANSLFDVYGYPMNYGGRTPEIVLIDPDDVHLLTNPDPGGGYIGDGNAALGQQGWLELPAASAVTQLAGTSPSNFSDLYCRAHYANLNGTAQRNYTMLYDPEVYTSYWIAYPLCAAHMGSGRVETWAFDPEVPTGKQTSVAKGYGMPNFSTPNNSENFYARGHQLPNADRNGSEEMQAQTFYSTNMTPQIHYGFNEKIWANLETAVRAAVPSGDTLYVVTGAAFRKKGGSETVTYQTNTNDYKRLPIPNYYWKVLLKVKRSGSMITAAKGVGVWFEHADYATGDYTQFTCPIDSVEAWTGFDFFCNLPGADNDNTSLESSAETNGNWYTFKNF